MAGFDAEQPVESQMAHYDSLAASIAAASGDGTLAHMELEQNKLNYQRQLITQASFLNIHIDIRTQCRQYLQYMQSVKHLQYIQDI